MSNIIKVVSVIIGAMIGAGFASGQEIYLFFFSYGKEGIIGIIISCIIIGLVTYKTLKIVNKYDVYTYKDFLDVIIKKNKKIKEVINNIVNIFLLVSFFIMVSGFGAYFSQELGINSLIGSGFLAVATYLTLRKSIEGTVKANEVLVPIMIITIIIIGIIMLDGSRVKQALQSIIKTNNKNYILSAVLYSSYNSILLVPVLIALKQYLKDKGQILKITIMSVSIIGMLGIIIYFLLTKANVDIRTLEMPAVYIISRKSKLLKYIYGVVILGSIYTTAVSLGTSYLQNRLGNMVKGKTNRRYTQIAGIMCITSVLISKIGFSNLVGILFPVFGYLGLMQICSILYKKQN